MAVNAAEGYRAVMAQAVVLVSGGLDSATALAVARRDGFACIGLSFDYGQRHRHELDCARRVCESAGVADHRVLTLDTAPFAGSALTDGGVVPPHREGDALSEGIPETYVPARNTVFLSMALGLAETLGAHDVFIGVNAMDYSGYPDCRPEFIEAFNTLANLATRDAVSGQTTTIHAPLLHLTKAEIVRLGTDLGVDWSLTSSCYAPGDGGAPCLRCEACFLRAGGFADAGVVDPLIG